LEQERELVGADANDRGSGFGILGGREPLIACAGKPILESPSSIAGLTWREPRQPIEKEPSDDDKRREPKQAG
jgi:hypothetical protein